MDGLCERFTMDGGEDRDIEVCKLYVAALANRAQCFINLGEFAAGMGLGFRFRV